jgi:NAD/NADP transhydrogenase beta subunit
VLRYLCAAQFIVQAEMFWNVTDASVTFSGMICALFRLNRLVQTLGQTSTRHHPSSEFVNQHNLVVAHVSLSLVNSLWAQTLIDMVHD